MVLDDLAQGIDLDGDAATRLALIRKLARTGFPVRARAMALELYAQAEQQGDEHLAAESAGQIAWCSMMTAEYEQGIRYGRVARNAWLARGWLAEQAITTGVLALLFAWIGEPDAVSEAEEALTLAERSGDATAIVWTLQAKCLSCVLLKQPQLGLPFGEHAVALSRQQPTPSVWPFLSVSESVIWCSLRTEAGENAVSPALQSAVARAIAYTREGLLLARKHGDGWMERLLLSNVAEYSLYIGDAETADAALGEFDSAAGEATDRCRAMCLLIQGRSLAARQRYGEALQAFHASNALLTPNNLELASMCQSDLSDTYAKLGRFDAALTAYRAFHALFVRRASEAAERRSRVYLLKWETDTLREAALQAQAQVSDLSASNEQLSRETQRLLRASMEDPLTGLSNRRRLEGAFLELLTTREPFFLAMLDVDRFKQVNDRFSHQIGDRVLCQLGELLSAGVRAQDLVVRYGGEEFAILLRGADAVVAAAICERLRQSVQAFAWDAVSPGLSVTISIGLAMADQPGQPEQVMAQADRRLYSAKQRGRNRLVAEEV